VSNYSVIVIGTSWGGLDALGTLLHGLPVDFAIPIVAVQHRGRDSRPLLASLLQQVTGLQVREAEDKDPLEPGHVLLAPPDYHLLIDEGHITLDMGALVKHSRPSIDVTFLSAADTYGPRTIGVVLTGANDDGAVGLRRIADRGGTSIVEHPASATSSVMPAAALRAVPQAAVLPLAEISPRLVRLANGAPVRRRS
jgi:two-component system chemotaxis response regulator CheB